MWIDKLADFADGMSIVGTAATEYPASYSYDLGVAGRDLEPSQDLYIVIQIVTQVAATGGAANVTFKIVDDDVATLASPTTLLSFGAIAKATLAPGYRLAAKVPASTQRYIGVTFTPDTNDTTGGTFDAFITPVVPKNVNYACGFVIE